MLREQVIITRVKSMDAQKKLWDDVGCRDEHAGMSRVSGVGESYGFWSWAAWVQVLYLPHQATLLLCAPLV